MKFAVLVCVCVCAALAAGPEAAATNADVNYCYARVRGLDPGRLPPAYLVVQLRVLVSYRNSGTKPLILPLERERTIYTSLKQGAMNKFPSSLLDPSYKVMQHLPADVSPDNPVDPKNDVFGVIPAGGEMPLIEEITLPVNRKALFRNYPDLRGHKVYIRFQFAHRGLSPALTADLSDRWSRFGVPWTGTLTTNTFTIDVPADPQAAPCRDNYTTTKVEPPVTGK